MIRCYSVLIDNDIITIKYCGLTIPTKFVFINLTSVHHFLCCNDLYTSITYMEGLLGESIKTKIIATILSTKNYSHLPTR